MTALALFDVLTDFGSRPQPAAVPPRHPETVSPQPDIGATVASEVARAEAALEERLSLAHAAELEAQRQQHAAEMDAVFRQIGETAGETIALRLGEMEERIGHQAAMSAARVLGTFLSDELQKRSLESLAQSIRKAVAGNEAARVDVRGPSSLLEALQAALGERAAGFGFAEAPGFDLSVTIDGHLLETRLSEWSAILSEIVE
ncbi:hypothetical protein ABUE31_00525 [Mesorhizobium sp. ZMM04-5]|uniref:Flagellar assembly protein FliH/Type III secretion system HrpE domain-containing protein n=1 Tax=Mesorhizobium marinum TaxID=3228790 RepID=A0ABV3QTS4_9HYPH